MFVFVYIKFDWNFLRHFKRSLLYKALVEYIKLGFFLNT